MITDRPYLAAVLDQLGRLPAAADAQLVLRHSIRPSLDGLDLAAALAVPLTPAGEELARGYGAALAAAVPARALRLFHSPVRRCQETAGALATGALAAGARVEQRGARDFLGASFLRDPGAIQRLLASRGVPGLLRDWMRGRVARHLATPAREAGEEVLAGLLAERGPAGSLDLHVTHDVTMGVLAGLLLGPAVLDEPYPDYLEGLLLWHEGPARRWWLRGRVLAEPALASPRPSV